LASSIRFRHIRWQTVAELYRPLADGDEVLSFLHEEFPALLKEAGLMIDRVSSDLVSGTREIV
jgi:hypothetical protein